MKRLDGIHKPLTKRQRYQKFLEKWLTENPYRAVVNATEVEFRGFIVEKR